MNDKVIKKFKLTKGGVNNQHWRVLIPKNFWEDLELKEGDNIEISINDDKVIKIRKVEIK